MLAGSLPIRVFDWLLLLVEAKIEMVIGVVVAKVLEAAAA